jgi:hypothetical protein
MKTFNEPFVHVLLFQCGGCGGPIPVAVASGEQNAEQVDAGTLAVGCNCGWSGTVTGVTARRRWTLAW